MGKRKRDKEKDEVYIKKKIKKLQEKLQRHSVEPDRSSTPPVQPQSKTPQQPPTENSSPSPASSPLHTRPHDDPDINAEIVDDELPEEFLLALGTEGQEQAEVGNPIRPELASRWTKIMNDGLGKEAREAIVKKYPPPANFSAAIAPIINPEIASTLSDPSVKRDKRIMIRQGLTGTLLSCLGKCLTDVLLGNINSKKLIEEINDAAKLAGEIHHHDSNSRKFFCLAGANKTIQDAIRHQKTDKFLFGTDCADKIRAAQTIQKTSNTIKNHPEKEKKQQKQAANNKQFKQLNWKSPPQYSQQNHRMRGGQQYHQPRKHYNQPHRKERHSSHKQRSRYHR
ncbi:uncharacterized protein LOC125239256 [Leguminivora glycinivorella]|uniref:uncharacterized protein LOC125239256 n=1 Tax=Leguminivora glycinivorella TaxID=1035111 RepID=UPI00200DB804|nr:uncharacterized protein LOC125239256 [Leguminivora glycinivorella]